MLAQLLIIHPFSVKHSLAIAIILNASSPTLSFKPLSLVLHLLDVGVVLNAIAHIYLANPESLILLLSFLIIQHAPTIGLIIQHIAFPSLSIIIQIQHFSMLDSLHLLSIHSQQRMRVNTHFDHATQTQFHHSRRGFFNQPFMIPAQPVLTQHQVRILHILLQYQLIRVLILQDLHQWNQ